MSSRGGWCSKMAFHEYPRDITGCIPILSGSIEVCDHQDELSIRRRGLMEALCQSSATVQESDNYVYFQGTISTRPNRWIANTTKVQLDV